MPSPVREVLAGTRRWAVDKADCIQWMDRLPSGCVDLVFFSPPYEDAREYGIGFNLKGQEWVDWMRDVVRSAVRVSAGLVAVNMSAKVRNHAYSCAVEWLVTDLTREDGLVCWPSPYAWVKMEDRDGALPNGIPGSGGKRSQRRDWEPIYCFGLRDRVPPVFGDNLAFGARTGIGSYGGDFSHRDQEGRRANEYQATQKALPTFQHGEGGEVKGGHRRVRPEVSNPGNVIGMHSWNDQDESWIRSPVGGGKLGHDLAHESHAPMPVGVAERFVKWFTPPDGVVLDPFLGSGTTIHAALKHGRRGIGCDIVGGDGGVATAIRRLTQVMESF